MRPSTGTSSGSLLPPVKLYFGAPVHFTAGAGNPAGSSGAKSNDLPVMLTAIVRGLERQCTIRSLYWRARGEPGRATRLVLALASCFLLRIRYFRRNGLV